MNEWEKVSLEIYETHMSLSGIEQLQALEVITENQLNAYPISSVAIFGIAGGNGLSHVDPNKISRVVGYDINGDYLAVCRERYEHLKGCLELVQADLSLQRIIIPRVGLIIANLLIEYIGIEQFVSLVRTSNPKYVSCAIQVNGRADFVSQSPYSSYFEGISQIHKDINPDELSDNIQAGGYNLDFKMKYGVPGGKYLLRLDYVKKCDFKGTGEL